MGERLDGDLHVGGVDFDSLSSVEFAGDRIPVEVYLKDAERNLLGYALNFS